MKIKPIVHSILVFIISLILTLSFVWTWDSNAYDKPDAEPTLTYNTTNISEFHNCELVNNEIVPTGENAYILYTDIPKNVKTIQIDFIYNNSTESQGCIEWKMKFDHQYVPPANFPVLDKENYYLYDNEANQAQNLKIIINNSLFKISEISLYEEPLNIVSYQYTQNKIFIIIAIIAALILTTIIYFINKKLKIAKKIAHWLKLKKTYIWKTTLTLFALLIIGAVIELILSLIILGENSQGTYFNSSRYIFIVGILTGVLLVYLLFKNKIIKEEIIFAIMSLSLGTIIIIGAPFGQICWDFDSHFSWVKGMSNINPQASEAEQQLIWESSEAMENINTNLYKNEKFKNSLNKMDTVTTSITKRNVQISHIPGALIYSTSKFLKAPITLRIQLVRFLYLILYTLICYFAIKKLKTHKLLLITIATFPTSIFLACNITYDWWVTSFSMLGISYFLSELQQRNKIITTKDTLIMYGSLAIACLPKLIYIPIMLIPLFMRKNYFKNNKQLRNKYYITSILFVTLILISLMVIGGLQISSTGDARGGEGVNAFEQFIFILQHPDQYGAILANFMLDYLSPLNSYGYISFFAYLGGEERIYLIFFLIMILTAIFGNNQYSKYSSKLYLKLLSILFFVGTTMMIATSLYITFTPVASETINGCQYRYLIPLLFPFTSFLFSINFKTNINPKITNIAFTSIILVLSYFAIYTKMISFMI